MIVVERTIGNAEEVITFESIGDYMMFLVITGEADLETMLKLMTMGL